MAKSAIIIALFISFIIFSNAISPDAYDIPGFFTFGDSTMDPGNNNNLNTEIKAISLPYGEDFPTHAPTGRFSNGKLVADFLVATLNLSDAHPAYVGHVVSANDIGVSFASAGSGLDDSTAKPVQVTTMSDQIQQFVEYIGKLKALKGDAATQDFIKKSIFIISIGTNDMMFNYYLNPLRSLTHPISEYHDFLLGRLKTFLQQLHALGVRKFGMVGLPPIGCVPLQMTLAAIKSGPITILPKILKPKCVSNQNDDATRYNMKLQRMLQDLQKQFDATEKSIVNYIDIYTSVFDMATNPEQYGFKKTTRGCCGTGIVEMGPFCQNPLPTCKNHSEYLFWDSVHPSQAAYEALVNIVLKQGLPIFGGL